MKLNNVQLDWLGHDGFLLTDLIDNRTIYIDPYELSDPTNKPKADVVLITHSHYDHLSIEDLKKISTPKTIIICPPDCLSKLQNKVDFRDTKLIAPNQSITFGNITIEAIPAYNTNKKFHPKDNDWVGYIIDINSKRIYHAGDTDSTPELLQLKKIDIALLPVSGTYVMTAEKAAKAANTFKPKLAIPMHYGSIIGVQSDAEKFKELCNIDVEILEKI